MICQKKLLKCLCCAHLFFLIKYCTVLCLLCQIGYSYTCFSFFIVKACHMFAGGKLLFWAESHNLTHTDQNGTQEWIIKQLLSAKHKKIKNNVLYLVTCLITHVKWISLVYHSSVGQEQLDVTPRLDHNIVSVNNDSPAVNWSCSGNAYYNHSFAINSTDHSP